MVSSHSTLKSRHPDKHPQNQDVATAKFQEISQAYEVLSDENARKRYDMGGGGPGGPGGGPGGPGGGPGGGGFGGGHPFEHRSPEDIFKEFFGTSNPFEKMFEEHFGGASPFDDMFGDSKKSRRRGSKGSRSKSSGAPPGMEDMMSGFGGMFGGAGGPGGGFGASFSSTTTTIGPDGRRVTKTVSRGPDGVERTTTSTDGEDMASALGGGSKRGRSRRSQRNPFLEF